MRQVFDRGEMWLGDCLELMADIPDGSVDMILCDLPYKVIGGGTSSGLASGWKGSVLGKNDGKIFAHNNIKIAEYLPHFFRVLKNGSHCYIMTNNLNLAELLDVANKTGFGFHNLLVWRKNTCTANRWYMKEIELVCFLYKTPAKPINNMSSKQIFEFDNPRNKLHPTEKPVDLMKHYISNSSKIGDLVLEPFSGSGTTAVAAHQTGRRYLCIERDMDYYFRSLDRVAAL